MTLKIKDFRMTFYICVQYTISSWEHLGKINKEDTFNAGKDVGLLLLLLILNKQ